MKIFCTLSATYFYTTDFRQMRVEGIHPFFSLPTKHLVSRASDWAQGKLSETESKVLFVALLHALRDKNNERLVEFRTAATPSAQTIQYNMEPLINMVGWYEALDVTLMLLPHYVVNYATRDLKNIDQWINSWNDIKNEWRDGAERASFAKSLVDKLRKREEALSRLIKSPQKRTEDFAGLLARWAMVAANVPAGLREYWSGLFKLKGDAVYLASTNDLDEMVEHMENNLNFYSGGIYAHSVIKHVRNLLLKNRSGDFGLGIPTGTDYNLAIDNPYQFVEADVEKHNKAIAIADAPEVEPKKEHYPNILDFIRAKAAWGLAQSHARLQAEYEKQQLEADALDNLIKIESAEVAAEEADAAKQAAMDFIKPKDIKKDDEL